MVLIAGEPGVGKSRLADELARRARDQGLSVLWGRGWEDAGAPPYWPWIQALRTHVRETHADVLRRMLGSAASDLAQMLPEIVAALPDVAPSPDSQSDSARFQLFDSVSSFLRRASADRPILVVLDDLHAADQASLLLLRFVASQLADMAILLVGTYRDVALTPDHPLTATIPELAREPATRIMALAGLQPAAVGRFIGATVGVQPHDLLVNAVWRETAGNPLFVTEALRLLTAEGQLDNVTDLPSLRVAVPTGVRDVILRRVDGIGQEVARLLRLAAALGPEFRVEVLRRLAEISPEDAVIQLDTAVREGLLLRAAATLHTYHFAHDLIRESLYDDLAASERIALHHRVMDVLESTYAENLDEHLAELAHHAFEAVGGPVPGGDGEEALTLSRRAVDYATRAGERASRSLAYEEAARLYGMALALLARDFTDDNPARVELLLRQGDALARSGELALSRTALLDAATLARRTGSGTALARAALGVGGRLPWARPGRHTALPPLLQDALFMLGGADDGLRVRLLVRLACSWRSSPERREESASLAMEAVELARQLEDPATLTYALAGLYWATWWPENEEQRLLLAEEMVEQTKALGDAERLIDAHLMLYMAHAEIGNMQKAKQEFEQVARFCDELRQPAQLWLGTAPRTLIHLLEGRLAAAEDTLARELEATQPLTPARDEVSAARFHVFLLRREQGRPEDAIAETRAAVADFPWYPLHRAALALLLLDLGRDDEARAELVEIGQDRFALFNRDNEWLVGMCLAAEAAARLELRPEAEVLYGMLLLFGGRHAIAQAEGSVGAVDRYLGLLASVLGRAGEAVDHLRRAVDVNRRLGAVPWVAHAQHDLADALRVTSTRGAAREAQALDAEAGAAALRLGLVALTRRLGAGGAQTDSAASGAPALGSAQVGTFRPEGEYWSVALDGRAVRIRASKGMGYLARLLSSPGQELHALDLAGATAGGNVGGVGRARGGSDDLGTDPFDGAGPLLDAEAKVAYRSRLRELDDELAEAESWNDSERAARLREEKVLIVAELSHAVGMGGRDRPSGSAAERARLSVTRAVRSAMQRISEQHPELGKHLHATIRTGTFCSYTPDPRAEVQWEP